MDFQHAPRRSGEHRRRLPLHTFADPAAGTYGFTGTGTDATYVTVPLDYSGPYFQTGCSGFCESTYTTRFDNVRVGVRCAP